MKYLASLPFFLFGIWLVIDHKLNTGATWDWSTIWQPWHHEGLAFWSILIGIGVIIWWKHLWHYLALALHRYLQR